MADNRTPKPPEQRRRRNVPERGEWKAPEATGWQHGAVPEPPEIGAVAQAAWQTWFGSWFAAFWTPEDVPGLRVLISLYDERESYRVEPIIRDYDAKGNPVIIQKRDPSSELLRWMDWYGVTPKGQQDRRWRKPEEEQHTPAPKVAKATPYGHLSVVKR